jgi:hypothetical protein
MDQSIREDYAYDDDDTEMEAAFAEIDHLENRLHQLVVSTNVVERFGVDPLTLTVLKNHDLLSGTAMEALDPNSFGFESKDSAETQLALEGLIANINDTAGRWSAKIVATTRTMIDKVGALITPLWDKVSSVGKRAVVALGDAATAGARTVRAHPFATVAVLVTAAVSVIGIIAYVTGGIPFSVPGLATVTNFVSKVEGMIAKIKLPFGKITTTVTRQGTKLGIAISDFAVKAQSSTVEALGWTRAGVNLLLGKLSSVASSLKTGFSALGTKVIDGVKKIDAVGGDMGAVVGAKLKAKSGSNILSWATKKSIEKAYDTMLWSVVFGMLGLIKKVVNKAFLTTTQSLQALASGHQDPEPQPA